MEIYPGPDSLHYIMTFTVPINVVNDAHTTHLQIDADSNKGKT